MAEATFPPILTTLTPILGSTLTISVAIWRNRPNVSKMKELGSVINYANDMKISERKYDLAWGAINYSPLPPWIIVNENGKPESRFNHIFLTEIPKNASIELYYFKFDKLEENLSKVAYKIIDNPWDDSKKIYLETRKYFIKNKINTIYTIVKSKIPLDYEENIRHYIHENYIEITNNNNFTIINYEIDLPYNITHESIDRTNSFIDIVERIPDTSSPTGEHLKLIIRQIPNKQVDQPGKIKIPFIPLS